MVNSYLYPLFLRKGGGQVEWNSKIFFKIIILQDFDFLGAGHLWFLPALLYIYILYYASLKLSLKQKNRIYFFIPLLFLLRIIVPAFSGYNWHWRGNFLITGVP